MNITAEQIQKTCIHSVTLEHEILEIIKTFQNRIIEAGKYGLTGINIDIPTNFNITNMNNSTAQTIIYSRLINELEKKHFNVKIEMTKQLVRFFIRWDIQTGSDNLTQMRDNIASHLV
jgi:hypothetical protein